MDKLSKFGCIWAVGLSVACAAQAAPASCARTVTAAVVAIDQPMMINRLGAARPGGMIYALRGDVVAKDGGAGLVPGNVKLRKDKRPRPIVLRVNAGDCLTIEFDNLLVAAAHDLQPSTRAASIHVAGLQAVKDIGDDGINAGQNANPADGGALVAPGHRTTYHLYAPEEGSFLLYSTTGDFNGFNTDQLTMGLFGAVNVQPKNAEWYRSQVSEEDMRLATTGHAPGSKLPIINYDALYPAGHPRAGIPVLKMLDSKNRLVHSDLTAVITGPNHGRFFPAPAGAPANPALPDQGAPYREVTVHYHESQDVVQAFPWFSQAQNALTPTLNAGADSFAINYGAAGIAAEILANRKKLGPGADCDECKFEEFFLSSWVGGDPSMVVDVPANSPCTTGQLEEYAKTAPSALEPPCAPGQPAGAARASKAYFPDDPSNVYHSYLGDRARFRILHAGAAVHHVHHHHAHQWLQSAGSDVSAYLDSQAIGPGASYTLDLVYDGSGNRNLTAGDSIFHCHFYPHFASGMWALFRVHDVFEAGTPLSDGRPTPGARALPDAEILRGTPIPALLPLPTRPMAPWPAQVEIRNGQVALGEGGGNPGYPFFVPGRAGHRPPHPPMDFAVDGGEVLDGGLPRHLITKAEVKHQVRSSLDFSKDLGWIQAIELPEEGTPAEQAAMAAHSQKTIATFLPDGAPGRFKMNGLPPAPGAPFANPGLGVDGKVRHYRGASLQVDAVFNKKGWHYPQQRMMALWGDVKDILSGEKPPEPLFFRAHSDDVVEYWHTNLVPAYYELDDFQVRTPTDIIGQHIHLVKFDVLASDGAANGFNYEDGTFSPEEVRRRIEGINATRGLLQYGGQRRMLGSKAIAALGCGPRAATGAKPDCSDVPPAQRQWLGAQATVQRWWVDPLLDRSGNDRTFMTVFTHDHFGPSTHQMTGLYGGLLIEPAGSTWTMPDGRPMNSAPGAPGTRADGGPTSYAANILPKGGQRAYREFALAWGDLQLAYGPGSRAQPDCYPGQDPALFQCKPLPPGASYANYRGWADTAHAKNCPTCQPASPPLTAYCPPPAAGVPAPVPACPMPYLISDFGAGIVSMNYRGEPLPHRVDPSLITPPVKNGVETDLAHVFRSIPRSDATMSTQPAGGAKIDDACTIDCPTFPRRPISAGMNPADPYTPLLRAYEDDPVQIRLLVGSHTSMHDFTMHGLKWQHAPFDPNSGFRNSQFMILSEHFEALFTVPRTAGEQGADYLYNPSASYEGLTNGAWGLLRAYRKAMPDLAPLPGNSLPPPALATGLPRDLKDDCNQGQPCLRQFKVSALTVKQLLGENATLRYNDRGINLGPNRYDGPNNYDGEHPLNDPNAIVYVRDEDLLDNWRLRPGLVLEPLVLRAAAGDWIKVRLSNRVKGNERVFTEPESANRPAGTTAYSFGYADIQMRTSSSVGLHPQLLAFDITSSNGANVGDNPVQTVSPSDPPCSPGPSPCRDYLWYAGTLERGGDGEPRATPVEFGAVNLQPADPLMQAYHGLFGAIIIEPQGASWVEDPGTHTSATVFGADGGVFRDFTLMFQNDISMELDGNRLYDAGMPLSAFNYRSEPFFYRYGVNAAAGLKADTAPYVWWSNLRASDLLNLSSISYSAFDTSGAVSNALTGGDPVTPVFRAPAGMPVRFRVLHAPGIGDNQQVFELSGHQWQEQPYLDRSTRIGHNPESAVTGATTGVGPTSHFDIVIPQAGGHFKTAGDYLYRSATAAQYQAGLWGLFRVAPGAAGAILPDTIAIDAVRPSGAGYQISGTVTVRPAAAPGERVRTSSLTLKAVKATADWEAKVPVGPDGRWTYTASAPLPDTVLVVSPFGGQAVYEAGRLASPPPLTRAAAAFRSPPRRRGALK